ncbi:MAG: polyphosphate kinase 1 [Bacteroidales bacterium]
MKNKYTYNNREISWLYFNERLLQEAEDTSVPLIERIRFLGIYSNNLDEFYRVRVATLNRMKRLKEQDQDLIDINPDKILKKINELDANNQERFERIFASLVKELEKVDIHIINEKKINEEQGIFVRNYFQTQVRPNLFPVMIEESDFTFPLKDKSIYLGVVMYQNKFPIQNRMAFIKIPTGKISRFLILPSTGKKKYIMLLDDVIRYNLKDIFSIFNFSDIQAFTFKITRDAELDMDSDVSKSFLEVVSQSLKKRSTGIPVRFVYDKEMPAALLKIISKKLNITRYSNVAAGGRYHNFKDFMLFPNVGPAELEYPQHIPLPHKALLNAKSIFDVIAKQDIMLHFPYQSFHYLIDLLREASIDPQVRSIRITLYRLAKDSNVINALINAARNGKSVTVFLEFQARFDEEANIQYAEMLQSEGVRIIQVMPGFKVHSKTFLIRRKEINKSVYYCNVGTGNYNEATSTVFSDKSLLTSDPRITAEVLKVFELFEANYRQQKFKNLVVAPFKMREYFIKLLKNEIENHQKGKPAWAIIKLNNLVDEKIADYIYDAAKGGVNINVIVRGTSILLPEENGVADHLKVFGIIDRFLEHARVFVFCNGGDELYYISSADWMVRNFDNRIEVAVPVFDKSIQTEIKKLLEIQMKDNTKARNASLPNINTYRKTNSKKKIRSQLEIYKQLEKELKRGNK